MISDARENDDGGRDKRARHSREQMAEVSDIAAHDGGIKPVLNPERRESCRLDLEKFLVTYFPHSTGLSPFSDDHRRVISRMQSVVLDGGRQANVVYRGFAKALALDTPLPTPSGWTTMGEVRHGDELYDERGAVCSVVLATDVMSNRACYRVSFDDGTSVVCSSEHLWTVNDGYLRRTGTFTTEELAEDRGQKMNRVHRYSVSNPQPLSIPDSLPPLVDPYILGAWLGDGTTAANSITIGDGDANEMTRHLVATGETVEATPSTRRGNAQRYTVGRGHRMKSSTFHATAVAAMAIAEGLSAHAVAKRAGISYGVACGMKYSGCRKQVIDGMRQSLCSRLEELGVLNNKHIPQAYLRRSIADRLSLLQGLMDTDGTVSKRGHCSYSTKLPILRDGVRELLASLGIKSTARACEINGRTYWNVHFTSYSDAPCFRLARKAARLQKRKSVSICSTRRIVSIESVPSVPVKCIQVDSPSKLYLCSEAMIPTHNTTISENTALWATIYGHRTFVPVFGAESKAAEGIIDSIKRELETNDLLYEDFPEVCHAIRALEGKPQRQHSQHYHGARTFIEFTACAVVLPTIAGSVASGAILTSHGLTAAARGMKYKRSDGTNTRPDLVIMDDVQTEESAASPLQTAKRIKIIQKSILRMSGHRSRLGCILNGTIIEPDDLVDQLSDYKRNPAWQSERIPMVRKFADLHEESWLGEYARLRTTYDPELLDDQKRAHAEANSYYLSNREAMDAGCIVSWQSCYDEETEHSAIQHAYNILIDDGPDVFASECQNKPQTREAMAGIAEIRAADVAQRVNGLPRGTVPLGATHLVAHIDVQHSLLYWSVFACNEAMTGSIIDHNTFPEQNSAFFALRDAKRKLSHAYPESQPQAAVEQGLKDLIANLFTRTFKREDGAAQGLGLVLIDWSDGTMSEVVARVCRTSQWKALLMPAAGVGIGPGDKPMSQYPLRPNERRGRHWMESTNKAQIVRSVRFDVNYWKSRAADALTCPQTNPGAVTLFGSPDIRNKDYADHRMFADHCASEGRDRQSSDKTQATTDVWSLKPNRENHKWDNLVACLVGASMKGCGISDEKQKRAKVSIPDHLKGKRFA